LLSRASKECGIDQIITTRSQSIQPALLAAPYRTFLKGSSDGDNTTTTNNNNAICSAQSSLIVYCLPSSVTEYLAFAATEVELVRSKILSSAGSSSVVVAVYDGSSNSIVGSPSSSVDDVLAAVMGNDAIRSSLAASALTAFSQLDVSAIQLAVGPTKRKDVVIVVGSGGREHALAVALAKSPLVTEVLCCPGNGGTASEDNPKIKNVGSNQENDTVIALTKQVGARMVVVGPEAPLVAGLVDQMQVECPGVLVFGPTKAAAELEASKAFSKDFLRECGIPTAKYQTFTSVEEAITYVESLEENDRQVVKASGLAAGKGVLLPTTKEETIAAVKEIMSDKTFGTAGDVCVIESFLTGPEASCFALCDGKTCVLMPAAQDHKRALDDDEGLNTGGMGAYAPAPCVTPDLQAQIESMCKTTVAKMAERGTPYVGLLYAGMM
jgi:D-alanine-D-alanine ligase-like ATP-grasp enzyme